jgi:hypothetical protein
VLVSVLFVLSILDWREPRDEYSAPIGGTDS